MADLNVISPASYQNSPLTDRKSNGSVALGAQTAGSMKTMAQANGLNESAVKAPNKIDTSEPGVNPNGSDEKALNESSSEKVEATMEGLNLKLEQMKSHLRFERDEDTEQMVVFIKNSDTGEVIRQIPSSEFLQISKNITQYLEVQQELSEKIVMPTGLFANAKA